MSKHSVYYKLHGNLAIRLSKLNTTIATTISSLLRICRKLDHSVKELEVYVVCVSVRLCVPLRFSLVLQDSNPNVSSDLAIHCLNSYEVLTLASSSLFVQPTEWRLCRQHLRRRNLVIADLSLTCTFEEAMSAHSVLRRIADIPRQQ